MKETRHTTATRVSRNPQATGPTRETQEQRAQRVARLKQSVAAGKYTINSDVLVYDIIEALFEDE